MRTNTALLDRLDEIGVPQNDETIRVVATFVQIPKAILGVQKLPNGQLAIFIIEPPTLPNNNGTNNTG